MSEVKKDKKSTKTTNKKATEKVKEEKIKVTKKKDTDKELTKPRKRVKKDDEIILNSNDQKTYTTLCKISKIIVKIARICLMIIVPFIFLLLFVIPIIFKKVEINSNVIKINDASIIIHNKNIAFKLGDNIHTVYCDSDKLDHVVDFLMNNSTGKIAFVIETILLTIGVIIVLEIYLLSNIESILHNMIEDKTPFTEENTNLVLKVCKLLLAIKVIFLIIMIVDLPIYNIVSCSIIELLIAFIIYYLFKYATGMQKIANTKICN